MVLAAVSVMDKNFSRRYAYSLEASLTVKEQYKRITFSVVVFLVVVISVFYEFPMSIPSLSYFSQLANNLFHDSLNCKSFNVIFVYIDEYFQYHENKEGEEEKRCLLLSGCIPFHQLIFRLFFSYCLEGLGHN